MAFTCLKWVSFVSSCLWEQLLVNVILKVLGKVWVTEHFRNEDTWKKKTLLAY